MCAPPFVTKQRPPIWKILDPPLMMKTTTPIIDYLHIINLTNSEINTDSCHKERILCMISVSVEF